MEPNCELRNASTVATQSLALMNGDFTLTMSKYLAERTAREAGTGPAARIRHAWKLAFGSTPSPEDVQHSEEFLAKQTAYFQDHPVKVPAPAKGKEAPPSDPPMRALTTFCQALLTSNQFLYID
jgi:hypothetical protein